MSSFYYLFLMTIIVASLFVIYLLMSFDILDNSERSTSSHILKSTFFNWLNRFIKSDLCLGCDTCPKIITPCPKYVWGDFLSILPTSQMMSLDFLMSDPIHHSSSFSVRVLMGRTSIFTIISEFCPLFESSNKILNHYEASKFLLWRDFDENNGL